MKITIPKVVQPVDLGGYAEALRGQFLHVWVNPPQEVLLRHTAILGSNSESKGVELMEWYAALWSHGPEETHWTAAELTALEEQDSALLGWMISQTWDQRKEHTDRRKKA